MVTGGTSGIGLATANLLTARGARVAVLDLQPPPGDRQLLHLSADVTDDISVRHAVDAVAERFGGLDILVNNAGIGAQRTWRTTPMTSGGGSSTSTSWVSSG